MKAKLYSSSGEKKSDLELPKIFSSDIREDIASKYFEAERSWHSYSSSPTAGKRHSASGTISHLRHTWKGHYGKGISRIPRKTMWRRGIQFYWVGAEISGTRGGRKAHPPKGLLTNRKVNRKEAVMAMNSAFASTSNVAYLKKRYSSISVDSAPFVIESLPAKYKDFSNALEKIFGKDVDKVFKIKSVRAGRGKSRGRKYKSNAGLLIIKSITEKENFNGLDVKTLNEISISDLYPLGRLTLYTKKALEEMEKKNVA